MGNGRDVVARRDGEPRGAELLGDDGGAIGRADADAGGDARGARDAGGVRAG